LVWEKLVWYSFLKLCKVGIGSDLVFKQIENGITIQD